MTTSPSDAPDRAPDAAEYLANEDALLNALLRARDTAAEDWTEFQVPRVEIEPGHPLAFRVHAISDSERQNCVRKSSRTRRDKRFANLPVAEERDDSAFNSWVIYTATHPDDRARLWDNRRVQQAFGVFHGTDLIEKILQTGEKLKAVAAILDLSGLGSDEERVADRL